MRFCKKIGLSVFVSATLLCSSIEGKTQQSSVISWTNDQRIYIHTDKNDYLAGELLWFKTYLVEASTNKPLDQNSIAYVELVNSKGKAVLQAKIGTEKSRRDGCFYLPADISTGSYTLVAYTNEMKETGPKIYFRKKINVVNTFKPLPAALTGKSSPVFTGFYPEGGSVVPGVPAKFGFYVMNASARKGLEATGVIINQKNDTVAKFSTLKFGMGQFRFTPLNNEKYTAIINVRGDSTIRMPLVLSSMADYSLAVENNGDKINVTAFYKSADRDKQSEKVKLLIHAREVTKAVTELELINGKAGEFQVERGKLGTGVICFTLFNAMGQPVCERLLFVPPASSSARIDVAVNKPTLDKREPLNIDLNLNGVPANDSLNGSLAIVPATPGNDAKLSSIYEYLLLGADLPGEIEDPGFYFTGQARSNPEYFDNLMLVNGWRRFSADRSSTSIIKPTPEYHGHVIAARVLDNWTNSPLAGVYCTLTVPSSPFGFYTGVSDSSGIVRFNVLNYLGPGSIVLKANSTIKPNPYKIEAISPFDERLRTDSSVQSIRVPMSDSISLANRSVAMQTINTYQHDEMNRFAVPVLSDTFPFFGKPEYSYDLDKYTRFSTMEEVLREYVTPIAVAMKGSKLTMSIYNEKRRVFYPDFMLVLLDGVPLSDPHQIFNYDPYKVKKIEIVPRRYLYGANQYYGIASFETYTGQFDAAELDPESVLVDYEGLQLRREFYSPAYTTDDKGDPRVPDLRTTLLWIPNIDLTNEQVKTVKGYTSDFAGAFRVIFCGLTASGIPVQNETIIHVK
ncbi:MAG: hypothetical protein DI535_01760 [Citrobacter freundii]|nr:MAG: hypothetical protein DI535_01760 [Citrobacter freundii]